MEMRKCNVYGCVAKGIKKFSFPRTAERALLWKDFCKNPKLESIEVERLHGCCRICLKHFDINCFTFPSSGRLLRSAMPTLFPPRHSIAAEAAQPDSSTFVIPSIPDVPPSSHEPIPSTSFASSPPPTTDLQSYTSPSRAASSPEPIPSTSFASSPPPATDLQTYASPSRVSSTTILENLSSQGRKKNLVSLLGVRRLIDLTPRKEKLYKELKKKDRVVNRLKKASLKMKQFFTEINDVDNFDFAKYFKASGLTNSSLSLLTAILKGCQVKPKGRRWTYSQKVFALSVFKKSPKAYNFMRTQVPLPSRNTLMPLIRQLDFSTGINKEIIEAIKSAALQKKSEDRFCTLIFDEMAVKPALCYSQDRDEIVGFTDHGKKGRSLAVAKQALVFMVRGIRRKWKQPVAYYFSHGSTPANTLADLIKEVLFALQETGLKVVATVCDMGRSNVKALELLGSTFTNPFFYFEGEKIFTVYDPPHLLKCFRNLFMKYDVRTLVKIGDELTPLVGKWQHLRVLDEQDRSVNFLPLSVFNLTEAHLSPTPLQKMRVYLAAEVFSRHVAAGIHALVGRNVLGTDGLATAQILMDVDSAFDSLNGFKENDKRKPLKLAVSEGSPHLEFWKDMIKKIDSLQFIGKNKVIRPPSQDGWLATMRAMTGIWSLMKNNNFWHLNTRNFNQDPLENFFNVLRQNCGSNRYPNAKQFQDALKTAIINNLISNQAQGNTMEDGCDLLTDLSPLFQADNGSNPSGLSSRFWKLHKLSDKKLMSVAFVGYHMATIFLRDNNCEHCRAALTTDPLLIQNLFLSFVFDDKNKESLCPSESFVSLIGQGVTSVIEFLAHCADKKNLSSFVIPILSRSVDLQFFKCHSHREEFHKFFMSIIAGVGMRRFCIEYKRKAHIQGIVSKQ